MIKIGIVDDDTHQLETLKGYIQEYSNENRQVIEVKTYENGLQLLSQYDSTYDLLLLDIEMPHMTGIELAKSIRKTDPHVVIIFITNMVQYAIKGYEVNAFDYMMKPTDYAHFAVKLGAALLATEQSEESKSILIPVEEGNRCLKAQEILFIEVIDHWLYINTPDGAFEMLGTLKEMEETLKDSNFIKCSKSCLINLQHVIKMRSDLVEIQGGFNLKISRARRKEVQFAFIDYYSEMRW